MELAAAEVVLKADVVIEVVAATLVVMARVVAAND